MKARMQTHTGFVAFRIFCSKVFRKELSLYGTYHSETDSFNELEHILKESTVHT